MQIHEILRASDVKRWSIVRTIRNQSVAEHSFNVAMIARAFAKSIGICDEQITKAALCHDLDEVITGDIPTPFKERARAKGVDLNNIYQHATGRTLTDIEAKILKFADLVEAYWYITEHGYGAHAKAISVEMSDKCDDYLCGEFRKKQIVALEKVIITIFEGEHKA